jgi:hypothetical protein
MKKYKKIWTRSTQEGKLHTKIFSEKIKKEETWKTEGQMELISHLVYVTTFLQNSKLPVIQLHKSAGWIRNN